MLTERQLEIVHNWESRDEGERNEVRERLRQSLLETERLFDLPPDEAREIVKSALNQSIEDQYSNSETKNTSSREEMVKRYREQVKRYEEYTEHIIAILFNAFDEQYFQSGVNRGVEATVSWWNGNSAGIAAQIEQNLSRETTASPITLGYGPVESTRNTIDRGWTQYRRNDYPSGPPEDEVDRLKRIFRVHGRSAEEGFFDTLVKYGVKNFDLDEIEDLIDLSPDQFDLDVNPYQYDGTKEKKKAIEFIKKSQDVAEGFAHYLNNPKTNVFPGVNQSDGYMRELLELHRGHLEEQGIFPAEEDLPEKYNNRPRVPRPEKLDLYRWKEDTS